MVIPVPIMASEWGKRGLKLANVLVLAMLGILAMLSFSRWHYQSALTLLERPSLDKALAKLNLSLHYLPFHSAGITLFADDLHRIETVKGQLYFRLAANANSLSLFKKELENSARAYKQAVDLNPYDSTAMAGWASTLAALQSLSRRSDRQQLYDALPIFAKAQQLRPNSASRAYAFILYLAERGMQSQMLTEIEQLMAIAPFLFYKLRKEDFYTDSLRSAVERGALQASTSTNLRGDALGVLRNIALERKDFPTALSYCEQQLAFPYQRNSPNLYLQAGRLALQIEDTSKAISYFLEAFRQNENKNSAIEQIFNSYHGVKRETDFFLFVKRAGQERELPAITDIYLGKSLMYSGQPELAIARFQRLTTGRYAGESYYCLARIYSEQKDWDRMELAAQKAVVEDRTRPEYHYLFARSLEQQKKYPQAEAAMNEVLTTSLRPNPWYFNKRGWIRYAQKKYSAAIADWQEASRLKPEVPGFLFQISLAYQAGKNDELAREYAERAVVLEPGNARYQKQLAQLRRRS
ncbi:tetratricopeptide repeat protein [Desulfotalea psychrophila]|uniref:Tetratricopeptide repeat protein n=1 Tax=Desulfotalea psychrophila (strain LSv54 / DSM 12343) TaxID=177439 RepID=Q6AIA0_DESPS|nr:tetratricopeptide repeat protein [Desulfotalea psychrophila]CAG37947.1 hypothetical protein DPPB83 [Desulfotalea psychrophila LSv54]